MDHLHDHHHHHPHILLLVTDQFRYDAFQDHVTPQLKSLAEISTTFANAYTSTPTCTPARAALLTGKGPWNHGMLGYASSVNCQNYPTTLPAELAALGYTTHVVGKNHFGTLPNGTYVRHGFQHMKLYEGLPEILDDYDEYFNHTFPGMNPLDTSCGLGWNDWEMCPYQFDEEYHPTAWTTRQALHVLNDFDFANERLFLKLSYHRPHSPYDAPKRLVEKHLQTPVDRFVNNTSWDGSFRNTSEMPHDAWHGDPGQDAARKSRAAYLAGAEFVDEGIGQVLHFLSAKFGSLDDFCIVWISDHSDSQGDHNLWRKGYPWESSAHIPFLMKLPHQRQPAKSQALVELRDVAPTLYDLVGILSQVKSRDSLMNGKSLLPVLTGQKSHIRTWLDLEHSVVYDDRIHWNALVGFDKGKLWKYVYNALDGQEQLFCLSDDVNETHDLALGTEWHHVLFLWRRRLIDQFLGERRGHEWVKNGKLVSGRASVLFGTNFPCNNFVVSRSRNGTAWTPTTVL